MGKLVFEGTKKEFEQIVLAMAESSDCPFTRDCLYPGADCEDCVRDRIEHIITPEPIWRAADRDNYYTIMSDGQIFNPEDRSTPACNGRYAIGNYFETKEQAEAALDRIKALLMEIHEEQEA